MQMIDEPLTREERQALKKVVVRMQEQGWGIAFGLTFGLGLFVATNLLVVKGGERVGPHLGLLALYFPGYRVTFVGSLIGFVYTFVLGYGAGRMIATIYNYLVAGLR